MRVVPGYFDASFSSEHPAIGGMLVIGIGCESQEQWKPIGSRLLYNCHRGRSVVGVYRCLVQWVIPGTW